MSKSVYYAYEVRFHDAPEGHSDRSHYFFSLAAIFDHFTPSEVGCSVQALYRAGVREGRTYEGRRCVVRRFQIYRKPQRARA